MKGRSARNVVSHSVCNTCRNPKLQQSRINHFYSRGRFKLFKDWPPKSNQVHTISPRLCSPFSQRLLQQTTTTTTRPHPSGRALCLSTLRDRLQIFQQPVFFTKLVADQPTQSTIEVGNRVAMGNQLLTVYDKLWPPRSPCCSQLAAV
jgi:hypothetical protein